MSPSQEAFMTGDFILQLGALQEYLEAINFWEDFHRKKTDFVDTKLRSNEYYWGWGLGKEKSLL